jgi:hypothetical protein
MSYDARRANCGQSPVHARNYGRAELQKRVFGFTGKKEIVQFMDM